MSEPDASGRRVLALDPGEKRVGLAVSDPDGTVALGLPTFEAARGRSLVDHLRELLRAYDVERVVVGHPRELSGRTGPAAKRAEALARRLRRELGVGVDLWDERLTSVQAEKVLRGTRAPRAARDRVAAILILQSYLDHRGEGRP